MLKLEKKVLEFEFDGKAYRIPFPTMDQLSQFQKKSREENGNEDSIEKVIIFLNSLGLDEELCRSLQPDHANLIIEHLTEVKKN